MPSLTWKSGRGGGKQGDERAEQQRARRRTERHRGKPSLMESSAHLLSQPRPHALTHRMLGQLSGQVQAHCSLDVTRSQRRLAITLQQHTRLFDDPGDHVVRERIHNGHRSLRDACVGVHLFQHLPGSEEREKERERALSPEGKDMFDAAHTLKIYVERMGMPLS